MAGMEQPRGQKGKKWHKIEMHIKKGAFSEVMGVGVCGGGYNKHDVGERRKRKATENSRK